MKREVTERLTQLIKKYKYPAAVLLIGILLLCWPTGEKEQTAIKADEEGYAESAYLKETEERMEKILARISGVGELELMLTVESGSEEKLAKESSLEYSGSTAAPDSYSRSESFITVSDGGGDDVVVTKSIYPVYRGALVVCEGEMILR